MVVCFSSVYKLFCFVLFELRQPAFISQLHIWGSYILSNTYILSTYYAASTVLCPGDAVMRRKRKDEVLVLTELVC